MEGRAGRLILHMEQRVPQCYHQKGIDKLVVRRCWASMQGPASSGQVENLTVKDRLRLQYCTALLCAVSYAIPPTTALSNLSKNGPNAQGVMELGSREGKKFRSAKKYRTRGPAKVRNICHFGRSAFRTFRIEISTTVGQATTLAPVAYIGDVRHRHIASTGL